MTSNLALRNLANEEFAVKVESSNAIGEPIAQARALNSMKHWASTLCLLSALVLLCGCGGGSASNNNGGSVASVRATIKVGTAPSAIVVDSTADAVYVADLGTLSATSCVFSGAGVTVINGATGTTAAVSLDVGPIAIALNPGSHTAYVIQTSWFRTKSSQSCSNWLGFVTSIDTSTLAATGTIYTIGLFPGLLGPEGIAVNQSTGDIYLSVLRTVGAHNSIEVLGNNSATIPVGSEPLGVAINANTDKIYVANRDSNNVSVIDGASYTVGATVTDPNAIAPVAVAVNATTNTIYVANLQSNNITVIDGATHAVTATIPTGPSPSGVAVNSQTNFIYVANAGNSQAGDPGNVTVINGVTSATTTLSDSNAKNPSAVAVNSATNKIYVANSGSNNVTVIDGAHE